MKKWSKLQLQFCTFCIPDTNKPLTFGLILPNINFDGHLQPICIPSHQIWYMIIEKLNHGKGTSIKSKAMTKISLSDLDVRLLTSCNAHGKFWCRWNAKPNNERSRLCDHGEYNYNYHSLLHKIIN